MHKALIRFLQTTTLAVYLLSSLYLWITTPYWYSSSLEQDMKANTRDLLNQASASAYTALSLENDKYLTWLVKHLTEKRFVASASIFSQGGSELSFAFDANKIKADERTPEFQQALNQYQPYVKIVLTHTQDSVGFVRMRIDAAQMLQMLEDKHLETCQVKQYYFTLLFALLIVILELIRMPKSWYRKELHLDGF